jgi:hypothetical protein
MADWHDNFELPDELKTNPTLNKYETPEAAFQGLVEANSRLGRSITVPNEEATDEERKEFYAKLQTSAPHLIEKPTEDNQEEFWSMLGVPEKPDDYTLPEGVDIPVDQLPEIREMAKKVGLTGTQFSAFMSHMGEATEKINEARKAELDQNNAILKSKWGAAEPHRDATISALVSKFQDNDLPINPELLANSPDLRLFLGNLAQAFKSDPQAFAQPNSPEGMKTPEEYAEEAVSIRKRLLEGGRNMPRAEHARLIKKLREATAGSTAH